MILKEREIMEERDQYGFYTVVRTVDQLKEQVEEREGMFDMTYHMDEIKISRTLALELLKGR